MTRTEIERKIQPILEKFRLRFAKGSSDERDAPETDEPIRPDVRRVSLFVSLAQAALRNGEPAEGLEIGSGYGYLLFSMAHCLPWIQWTAIEHPNQAYVGSQRYRDGFAEYRCRLAVADVVREGIPFPDWHFGVVTFSEVLEHLPMERVPFVLSEVARVLRPGGLLLMSSPNQASLDNRLRLLRGKSILAMPDEDNPAEGVFGHVRLYTPSEMQITLVKQGLRLEQCVIESNNSGFRGTSERSWTRRIYRMYERLEAKLNFLRRMGDTWYMVFRKG